MNTFFTQLKKETEAIRMTPAERSAMRMRLEAVMGAGRAVPSPYFSYVAPRPLAALMLLVAVVVSGGTAYAAEGAAPGDILYPVKVGITEPLRGSLAFSSEAKAAWHAESALRRVAEAETLVARGTFTPEAAAELEEDLNSHVEQVTELSAAIGEKNPVFAASISTRLATSLGAHGAVISRLGAGSDDSKTREESDRFADKVNSHERTVAYADAVRTVARMEGDISATLMMAPSAKAAPAPTAFQAESDTDFTLSIELERNASSTLVAAEAELKGVRQALAATTTAEIERQIFEVRERLKDAREKRRQGDGASAKQEATRALREAAVLQAFLEAQGKFQERILPRVLNVEIESEASGTLPPSVQESSHTEASGGGVPLPATPINPLRF